MSSTQQKKKLSSSLGVRRMEENEKRGTTTEEVDQLRRSSKKTKIGNSVFSEEHTRIPRVESWMGGDFPINSGERRLTFREMLLKNRRDIVEENLEVDLEGEDEEESEDEGPGSGIIVEIENSGCANFRLSGKERARLSKPWKKTLIVKLLGKKVSHGVMKRKLGMLWGKKGNISVADVGNEFFFVRFDSNEDLDFALKGGPWLIFDHYLAIQKWEPNFEPHQANINKVAVWIRLPDLPMEYYDRSFLIKVGSWIGRVLKIDLNTAMLERGRFARLCVEINLNQPLKSKYKVDGRLKRIEYEALSLVCFACGKYGHVKEGCPSNPHLVAQEGSTENLQGESSQENMEDVYGPWMVVARQRRGRKSSGGGQHSGEGNHLPIADGTVSRPNTRVGDGSRFDLLQMEEEDNQVQGMKEQEKSHRDNLSKADNVARESRERSVPTQQKSSDEIRKVRRDMRDKSKYEITWENIRDNNSYRNLEPINNAEIQRDILKEKLKKVIENKQNRDMGQAVKAHELNQRSLNEEQETEPNQVCQPESPLATNDQVNFPPKPPDPSNQMQVDRDEVEQVYIPETPWSILGKQAQEGEMEVDRIFEE